jgi:predicted GH43/DUF377 family glycosyl hydrolase
MKRVTKRGLMLCAALLVGATHEASAVYMVPEPPWRPKEAALIKYRDTFHLFYTRGLPSAPFDSTWNDLGHAISLDLQNWLEIDPVLPARPGHWDNHQIWSPCVIPVVTGTDTLFYMFYTGLTHTPPDTIHHQRIGLAVSSDLMEWTRLDHPVFSCAEVPWSRCQPTQDGGGDFRDPWVMPDPDSAGHWLMYYTTRHKNTPGEFIIGIARSNGDLTHWQDAGPMMNTTSRRVGNVVVETPDVLRHNGLWYLFYTTWKDHPIEYQTAASPVADSTGWSPPISLADEAGWYTDPSFGPEHVTIDGHDLFYMPNSMFDAIQILEFAWQDPPHFDLVEPWIAPGAVDVPPEPNRSALALRAVREPSQIRLVLQLPRPASARLWIADLAGRRVRDLSNGPLPAGRSDRVWNLRADQGERAGAGVYFVVLDTPFGRRVARVAVLH